MYDQKLTSGRFGFYEEFTEKAFHGIYLHVFVEKKGGLSLALIFSLI